MNVNGYINKFGIYTFDERPFGDVDSFVLAELSMINFETLLDDNGEVTIGEIPLSKITPELFSDSPDRGFNKKQIINMINSKRFAPLVIKNVKRIFSEKDFNQFYAITVVLPNGDLYISFRGTDITLIGWKEDFLIPLRDTYLAQIQGLEYVQNVVDDNDKKFYIGGHSKGGNIAFYATVHLDEEEASRLIKSYSFDGPGLRKDMNEYPIYQTVHPKMVKYLTRRTLVGSIFHQLPEYKVVYSNGLLLGGHDPYYWFINHKTGEFRCAKHLSIFCKRRTKNLTKWLNSLPNSDKELMFDAFFRVFKNVKTVYDIPTKAPIDLMNAKKSLESYSEEEQKKITSLYLEFVGKLMDGTEKTNNKNNKK